MKCIMYYEPYTLSPPVIITMFLLSPSGDPKSWQNQSLPGDPNYLVGANCVSVLIDHF